jgi:DME family drug/metabolite transporter
VTSGRGVDPRLLVVAAASLWGTTGTARALGPDAASASAVGAARLVVGGACLLLAARAGLVAGARPAGEGPRQRRRSALGLAVATAAMAAYQPLFFGGVTRTGVAVGTVVGIGSAPILAGVLGAVVRGERPGRRWWVATGLALGGTLLLVGSGGSDDVDPTGIALAVGAGLAYAVYVLASKLLLDAGWPADAVTVRVFAWAGLVLVPVAIAGIEPLLTPGGLLMVAHLGMLTVAVAYVLFGRGLRGVGVGAAGTLTLAEPATAALLGVVVVGERFGATTVVGIALVAAGLIVLTVPRRRVPWPGRGSRPRRSGSVP